MEKNRLEEREHAAAKRNASVKHELAESLEAALHQTKSEYVQLEKALKETKDTLDNNQVDKKMLTTSVESLRSELTNTSEKYKEDLSLLTQCQNRALSTLKQEHFAQIHSLEKAIANLQYTNKRLENEFSKSQRDRQSSYQRCLALEKLFDDKNKDYLVQINALTNRALDAEAQLDTSLLEKQELKRSLDEAEGKLNQLKDSNKDMAYEHEKAIQIAQVKLHDTMQENEDFVSQLSALQNALDTTQRDCRQEREKMMAEVKRQLQEAQVQVETMKVSRSSQQTKAKEARISYEKAVTLHEATVQQMKSEAKDVRDELEKTIADERAISQVRSTQNALVSYCKISLLLALIDAR